ncbi:MAG: thioredoxin family protein [Myxococcota bacterium]|nr:thioredoxin family protein [Myxococcota bacterium]
MSINKWISRAPVLCISLAFSLFLSAGAWAADGSVDCEGGPIVVKIHADWCGSCKASKATWKRVETELAAQATVIEFDVSDRISYTEALSNAESMGVEEFFQEYRTQTGTVAVLACETRKPVEILRGERDFDKYRLAIEKASSPS